ncbi:hypothetical protein Droror1_Dr00018211, partial [Drosera rotundifolia]
GLELQLGEEVDGATLFSLVVQATLLSRRFRLRRQRRRREVGFRVRDHVDLGSSSPKRIDSDGLTPFKKNFYLDPKNSGLFIFQIEAYPKTTAVLVRNHGSCSDSWISAKTQVQDDLEKGVAGAFPIPSDNAGKEEIIAPLVANVEAMIKADRKITALKQLQGHIWRTGYVNSELKGKVYEDVPEALERWQGSGIKVYIYSSGSRLAQMLIFGNTNFGDLRNIFLDSSIPQS